MKTIFSYFLQTLLPPKATCPSSENIFFNKSFVPASGNLLSVQWKQYAFVWSLFSWWELEVINIYRKIFFCQWKPFLIFLLEQVIFCVVETHFSTNASLRVVETDFLTSTNHKLSFHPVETYFLMNPSLQLLEEDFLFSGNCLLYLRVLSYQPKPSLI